MSPLVVVAQVADRKFVAMCVMCDYKAHRHTDSRARAVVERHIRIDHAEATS